MKCPQATRFYSFTVLNWLTYPLKQQISLVPPVCMIMGSSTLHCIMVCYIGSICLFYLSVSTDYVQFREIRMCFESFKGSEHASCATLNLSYNFFKKDECRGNSTFIFNQVIISLLMMLHGLLLYKQIRDKWKDIKVNSYFQLLIHYLLFQVHVLYLGYHSSIPRILLLGNVNGVMITSWLD